MGPALISLLFALGVSGWIWAKLHRNNGGSDPKQIIIMTAVAGVGIFVVVYVTLKYVFNFG